MKGRGTVIGVIGLWLIIAGLWRFGAVGEAWSNVIFGIIVAILGFSLVSRYPGHGWVSGIFGLWMIASGFIAGLHAGAPLVINNVISGVIIAIAGFTVPGRPAAERQIRRAA